MKNEEYGVVVIHTHIINSQHNRSTRHCPAWIMQACKAFDFTPLGFTALHRPEIMLFGEFQILNPISDLHVIDLVSYLHLEKVFLTLNIACTHFRL